MVSTVLMRRQRATPAARVRAGLPGSDRYLSAGLFLMAVGLIVNSALGPFLADVIRYPFTATVRTQTIGLEAVSLLLIAPVALVAAALSLRSRPVAPVLAFGPASYTAYMFAQYIIGPGYERSARVVPFHLALFVLAALVAARAWHGILPSDLPVLTRTSAHRHAMVAAALAVFVLSRYLPVLIGSGSNRALLAEYQAQPGMFWSIFLLDLGVVVPIAVATATALWRNNRSAGKSLYALAGWFALVPPSVAAMGLAMVVADDPNASTPMTVMFFVVAVLTAAYAVLLIRRLLHAQRIRQPAIVSPSD